MIRLPVRIGGNGIVYAGNICVNEITLHAGDKQKTIDLAALTEADLANSYGDALKSYELVKLNGRDRIAIN